MPSHTARQVIPDPALANAYKMALQVEKDIKSGAVSPEFAKKHPTAARALVGIGKVAEIPFKPLETPFAKRVQETAGHYVAPDPNFKPPSTGNVVADIGASLLGAGLATFIPGGALGVANQLGRMAGAAAPVSGLISKLPGKAATLAPQLIDDAIGGAAFGLGESISRGDDLKQTAKNILIESAMDVGGGALVRGAGKALGKGSKTLAKALEDVAPKKAAEVIELKTELPQVNRLLATGTDSQPIKYSALKAEAEAKIDIKPTAKAKVEVQNAVKDIDTKKLKDISGFRAYFSDVYRNFRDVFGEQFDKVKRAVLDPFDASKKANIDMQREWATKLKTEVVDNLGIQKGSKESALVQQFGEKKITLEELKKQVPDKWQNIVEADKWFRKAYNNLLDEVNKVRATIYPNNPDKIVPRRKDYYRHFRDLADTVEGVKNLFETPSAIDPSLAGTSDFTLPKSRFASFMQKRGVGPYKNDAVGGFLDYIPAASYAINIDPHISRFRALADELAESTKKSRHLNHFIEYLRDFANDLAGKTNPFDRAIQKVIPGGRRTFRIINWLNSRVKANTVLGNISASLSQIANVPQGIAYTKQHSIDGFKRTVKGILTGNKGDMLQSGFLAERYASDIYRQFDTKLIDKPKKFAEFLLEVLDKVGTEFIWNSVYSKGMAEGIANPVKYADDITRNMVAGRGIGEMALVQKSRIFQLIAPFQVEVANLWNVQRDFVKDKDFGGLIALYVLNFLLNKGMEQARGSGVVFDPIDATIDAFMEEDTTLGQKAGRLGGEVLSNLPLGQTIAAQLPEQMRKDLFGRQDPTRYGTGLLLTEGIKNPAYRLALPFGGAQLEKTFKGATALGINPINEVPIPGVYNKDKTQLKYPVSTDTANILRGLLFGIGGLPETREYYEQKRSPLGTKQTEEFIKKVQSGKDAQKEYEEFLRQRAIRNLETQIKEMRKEMVKNYRPGIEGEIKELQLELERIRKGGN